MLFVQVGEEKVPAEFLLESHPHRYWLPAKKVKKLSTVFSAV
jgi:hypothetical protein